MKLPALLLCCVLFGASPGTAATTTAGAEPERFGTLITVQKPVDIGKLAKNPKRYLGKTVRLEGSVKQVCQGRGCWVEVASPKGASFMARSLDESVLLPTDCAGRRIVVQGIVTALPPPGAEADAHAEQKVEGHSCPTPSYVVSTQGIELLPVSKN